MKVKLFDTFHVEHLWHSQDNVVSTRISDEVLVTCPALLAEDWTRAEYWNWPLEPVPRCYSNGTKESFISELLSCVQVIDFSREIEVLRQDAVYGHRYMFRIEPQWTRAVTCYFRDLDS